jgi:predicted transcriptional regulator
MLANAKKDRIKLKKRQKPRTYTEIRLAMLQLCKHPSNQTEIIHKVNINFNLFTKLTKELLQNNCLSKQENSRYNATYTTTILGLKAVKLNQEINQILSRKSDNEEEVKP